MNDRLKALTGLGYRAPFRSELAQGHPGIGWLEIITENYLWTSGSRAQTLELLRPNFEIACHGVSLSIAAPEEHDEKYLRELKVFCDRYQPVRVSDHLCWSSLGGHHWHDLLPFPYTEENLQRVTDKVNHWQDVLKRPLVLENLSTYMASGASTMSEYAFLGELCQRSGCQILLDLNNMVVNARNFKIDPLQELAKINLAHVAQIHLAGFSESEHFVIDTHAHPPVKETWELFRHVMKQRSAIPFMLEWDAEIPEFGRVIEVLQTAQAIHREVT